MRHVFVMNKNIVLIIVILLLAFLERTRFLAIGGINPNLIIAGLAVSAFFAAPFLSYVLMSAVGALVMKSVPVFEYAPIAILVAAVFFWIVRLASPWRASISILAATIAGTAFFYAIVDYRFLLNRQYLFAFELVYNVIFAITLYLISAYIYGEER